MPEPAAVPAEVALPLVPGELVVAPVVPVVLTPGVPVVPVEPVPLLPVLLRSEPAVPPPMVAPAGPGRVPGVILPEPVPVLLLPTVVPGAVGEPEGAPVLVEEPGAKAEPEVFRCTELLSLPVVPPADPLLPLGVVVVGLPWAVAELAPAPAAPEAPAPPVEVPAAP